MKHGPIALLDEQTPVVVVATKIHVYDKLVSNIQEVRAPRRDVIAIATDGNEGDPARRRRSSYVRDSAFLRSCSRSSRCSCSPTASGALRGPNVDQPRNLAKTVTVE